jgi:hypothetical protein
MTQFVFGSGTLIGKRTDVSNTPPALIGTLQDITLDFDRKVETLLGQYSMAVAAGGGEFKITGKAKHARFQATTLNNLFLGQTLTSTGMLEMATAEAVTAATTTFTVANGPTFTEDLGVYYAATGVQLTPVTASPAQGEYVPGAAGTGTYTIDAADENAALLVYYGYTTSTAGQNKIALANQLMGPVPLFEVSLKESFNYFGSQKDLVIKLNACFSSKLALQFSNQKFAIPELDFQAIADAANNIGTIGITE